MSNSENTKKILLHLLKEYPHDHSFLITADEDFYRIGLIGPGEVAAKSVDKKYKFALRELLKSGDLHITKKPVSALLLEYMTLSDKTIKETASGKLIHGYKLALTK